MNIHEYQAKQLFEQYGIPVPTGRNLQSPENFNTAVNTLKSGKIVVKAQIHAGGRGKGTFSDGYKGGVKICNSVEEALIAVNSMLGNTLITKQTGPAGRQVNNVYVTEACGIEKEYYLALLLDRSTSQPIFIASTEGGMDIEEVAEKTPQKITRVLIDPTLGLRPFHTRKLAGGLGFTGNQARQMGKIAAALYRLFWEKDASLVEINPLITDQKSNIIALDAKASFDDNALFRHPDIAALRDLNEEDPKEVQASAFDLSYIALDGNIACLVNGAGLAMATMDIIKHFGGNPANFLDVGGGATEDQVTEAFRIILSDNKVNGILVNIFGGIMQCDIIAKGIINAARSVDITVPVVVRLEGTNVDLGEKLLAESGLALEPATSLSDAAEKIVKLASSAA